VCHYINCPLHLLLGKINYSPLEKILKVLETKFQVNESQDPAYQTNNNQILRSIADGSPPLQHLRR